MNVSVRLFATLARYAGPGLPGRTRVVTLPEGADLATLLAALGVPADEVKVCFVNGRAQDPDFCLNEGDEVGIFPPIGGGSHG